MNTQDFLTKAMTLGPFLTLILSSRKASFEDDGLRKVSGATTVSRAVICSARDAAQAQTDQPVMVNLGPMLRLLTTLSRRGPRRDRHRWQGPSLPPGCVMVVRYVSR